MHDGAEAYRRASEIRPDIIVTDLPTPTDDGLLLLQKLKEDAGTRDIPVVAVSGQGQRSGSERVAGDGFAFFPKPCLPEQLAAALRHVLGAHIHV